MGMIDFEYEEALKYRYEYWEREGWLMSCMEALENIGGRKGNWDMIDTIGMIVGRMDMDDNKKIAKLRNESRGAEVLSNKEAMKILKSKKGGTVWLGEWKEDGDDYPVEDPEELEEILENYPPEIIYSEEDGEYNSEMYSDGLHKIIKARLEVTREELKSAEQVIEDY